MCIVLSRGSCVFVRLVLVQWVVKWLANVNIQHVNLVINKGESASKLSVEFGVGKATITDGKKHSAKIEQVCTISTKKTEVWKTSKLSQFEKVDHCLFLRFTQERERGMPLSGPLIK
ncbi:hypothetical protein PR048_021493 [Dryococelus australis]|uniref:Uncharacterized protein n=1 Tax=Dryococelus australis TaxID=614101 RepID=A0ABQ9GYJ4_9NEOP|nr:hypothetical protein PR048_021493 [Dryococelus australis]